MKLILTNILISIIFSSCDNINYVSAVKRDSRKQFLAHRAFFTNLSFDGLLVEKKECKSCDINKYQIILRLKEIAPDSISIEFTTYPPYYYFNSTKQLSISVTKSLFEYSNQGMKVKKEKGSNSIELDGNKFYLLNDDDRQWLPR